MSVGLILEGGGMRGVFTAGVLDVFLEEGISFDTCIGVSAGSCHACSYLAKQKGRALRTSIDYLGDKRYCSIYSLITTGDLFGADFIYKKIPSELYPVDNEAFKSGNTAFYAVVTNCETGKAQYPQLCDLIADGQYIRASSSLPLVSRMVEIDGNLYLDGGIADAIPVRQSVNLGNKKNVVVLTRARDYRKTPDSSYKLMKLKYRKYPNLLDSLKRRHEVYNETLDYIAQEEKRGNVFVIAPQEPLDIGRVEKNKDKLLAGYEIGKQRAKECLSSLIDFMKD